MRKKLTNAEIKLIKKYPKDMVFSKGQEDEFVIEGVMGPYQYPKGTNLRTVENLNKLGIIKIAKTFLLHYPTTLTEKGKKILKEMEEKEQ